jgi:hypothetical protein
VLWSRSIRLRSAVSNAIEGRCLKGIPFWVIRFLHCERHLRKKPVVRMHVISTF